MNASYEWLRAFVPVKATPAELRDLITAHTATVEDLIPLRADLAPIVVGRVVEAARHPDSDHLWVTKVDAGGADLLEVICGAPNVTAGKRYPFAPVGTTLPNGVKIERRKIRGVVSNGMLCSARELGLGDEHEGILELVSDAAPGTPFLSIMPAGDTRLVVDVGANRPDLLSHLGLARELSAVTGTAWQLPTLPNTSGIVAKARSAKGKGSMAGVEVSVEPDTAARRYIGAVLRDVKIGPSPEWLVGRLDAVGVRSISNVVDATNYVLHEMGQPIHAFDLRKLAGKAVVVRKARANERLTTLDGIARSLPKDTVVIADGAQAQAVAGVMGGRDSEVTAETTELFIEVASFDPKSTRKTRRALGISTDASYRFERGVDPDLAPLALDRVLRLIMSIAGGALADAPLDVVGSDARAPLEITLRAKRVLQVLGTEVPLTDARRYLEAVGFELVLKSDRELKMKVPTWRTDVSSEIDLVEEVARFHGYDKFPDEIRPFRPSTTYDDPLWTAANRMREVLVGLGLLETRPMPFVHGTDESHVRVDNPLSANEAYLRATLLETLARRAEFNLSHRSGDVRIFEIGSVFPKGSSAMPREQVRAGVLVMGRSRPAHFTEPQPPAFDEWDAKGIGELAVAVAYPGQRAELQPGTGSVLWQLQVNGKTMGQVERVSLDAPVWAAPAFGLELILGEVDATAPAEHGQHAYHGYLEGGSRPRSTVSKYRALPTMPSADIDLALLVPHGTTVADVERVIRTAGGEMLERLELFDQYVGEGVPADQRSLAWRLTFRHPERTLRDKEIEGRRGKILGALEQELHVHQR